MPRTVVLDTSVLSVVTKRFGVAEADACREWLEEWQRAKHQVRVPSIAYYELARELARHGNTTGLARLDSFCSVGSRYLPLTDSALRIAVSLWAQARNAGTPTADPKELDCDVLIAAQALEIGVGGGEVIVATTNVGHLAQFVAADLWQNIKP